MINLRLSVGPNPNSPGPEPNGDCNTAASTSQLPSPTPLLLEEMDAISLLAIDAPSLFMSFDPNSGFNRTNAGTTATPETNKPP